MAAFDPASAALDVERLLGERRWLGSLARRLASDADDAEDLAQETWLKAWQRPAGDPERTGGWLRVIASRLALRRRERAAARAARERLTAVREAQPSTATLVAQVELQRALAEALLALDEAQRQVVLLRFYEELPPRAIAARLGLPVETVRTRQKRALAKLRERLDAKFGARDAWGGAALAIGATAMSSAAKGSIAAGALLLLGIAGWQLAASGGQGGSRVALSPEPRVATAEPGTEAGELPAPTTAEQDARASAVVASRDAAEPDATAPLFTEVEFVGSVVEDKTAAPLAGATVELAWEIGTAPNDAAATRRTLAVTTGTDGRFTARATNVVLDHFEVSATHATHARVVLPPRTAERRGQRGFVDFGAIALPVGVRVRGRVITLPERRPIADASLFLRDAAWSSPGSFSPDYARPVGTSRGDGSFELADRVVTDATLTSSVLFAVGGGRVGFALFRALAGGADLDLEVGLEAAAALTVRVVEPDGDPARDAIVTAYPAFAPFGVPSYRHSGLQPLPTLLRAPWTELFRATTDAAGRARFTQLLEGRADPLLDHFTGHLQGYQLHVEAPGWPRACERILVERGSDREVTVTLLPPTRHRVTGRVTDARGGPIAGAAVAIEGFDPVASDADGRYATAEAEGPIGDISGKASASGFAPQESAAHISWVRSRITTRPHPDAAAAASAGATTGAATGSSSDDTMRLMLEEYPLDFALVPAGRVSGRVVDQDDAPIAGVVVHARGYDFESQTSIDLEALGGATGDEGRFTFDGIPSGGAELMIDHLAGFVAPFPQRVRPGGDEVTLVLQRLPAATARVIVRCRDAATGEPIAPVTCYAWPTSSYVLSRPGATIDGTTVTVDQLFPGDWLLSAEFADGRRAKLPFRVATIDQQQEFELQVGALATIEGQLWLGDAPLRPQAGAQWFVWITAATNAANDSGHQLDAEERPVGTLTDGCAVADAEGRFVVGQLTPGIGLRLWVESETHIASATVVPVSGERRKVELRLLPQAPVAWRLGEALPAGRIELEVAHDEGPFCREATLAVDRVGSIVQRGARPAGPLRWRATWTASIGFPPAQRVATGEATLTAGNETTIELAGFE